MAGKSWITIDKLLLLVTFVFLWASVSFKNAIAFRPKILVAFVYCADLSGANLTGANLTNAKLAGANLYGTNFKSASVYHAKFNSNPGIDIEHKY